MQIGFLEALSDQGIPVTAFGGTPHSAWPRGSVFAPAHEAWLCGGKLRTELTGYLNLPIVKLFSQHALLRRKIVRMLGDAEGRPAVVFSYNLGLPEALTGRWLQREFGVPWVCVVADYPETSDPRISRARRLAMDVYGGYQRQWLRQAAGRVYLSWSLFEEERLGPKLHLDGGIVEVHTAQRPEGSAPRVVLFAGTLSAYAGIDLLLDAFRQVKERRCELWICGRGNQEDRVLAAAQADPRIHFFGLLGREELQNLMARADVFVNPRPSALPENRANFPSKLHEYLSWCRPVISTLTPGIAPAYREILVPVEDETPAGLATVIEQAVGYSQEEREELSGRIRCFVEEKLLWSVQAKRLWDWIEAELLEDRSRSQPRKVAFRPDAQSV